VGLYSGFRDGTERSLGNAAEKEPERVMTVTKYLYRSAIGAPLAGGGPAAESARTEELAAQAASAISRRGVANFLGHFLEMCAPMCIGFAVGDLAYFAAAAQFGYSHPFSELPELSVGVVTVTMTAPMVAWMLFRGMPQRATAEMSAVMPVLAIVLLALGWLAIVPKGDLALLEHGLMMPAMLLPMLVRLDLYTGRSGGHHRQGRR
jgi:hypothetical protein